MKVTVIKRLFIVFCIANWQFAAYAQTADSLKNIFNHRPKFFITLEGHNSIVTNRLAKTLGIRLGLAYNNQVRIGIGMYWLVSVINRSEIISQPDNTLDTVETSLHFAYFSPSFEYIFYKKDPWQFSVPVHLGFGSSYFGYLDNNNKAKKQDEQFIMLYEPTVVGHYKILKWFGIGFGTGFRLMLVSTKTINQKFTSPIYVLNLKIFFGDIYRTVFPKKHENG